MPQHKQEKQNQQEKKANSKSKSNSKKQGGNLMNDVRNLAVPFAILLAKEGLTKVFKDDSAKPKKTSVKSTKSVSASTASKPKSLRRRSVMTGGSCNLGCGMTGGMANKKLVQLQEQIDNFLQKY